MWWTESLGRLELQITRDQARRGSHPGPCDADIADLRKLPAIRRQLQKLDPALVAESLREYGAWDDEELSNHDANLSRLLWLACGDIVEETN